MYLIQLLFVFVLTVYVAETISSPSSSKRYRTDYIYNSKTDAFYKLHIETARNTNAQESCVIEGGKLMVPATQNDIVQAHALFKRYPDIGGYFWVGDDGAEHESAEEQMIIHENSDAMAIDEHLCTILTREGEIESYHCYNTLPFLCKVQARDAPYDTACDVSATGYEYNATVGSCYKISKAVYPWGEAASECEAEGAHLAIINSEAEHEALWELIKRVPSKIDKAHASWFFSLGFRANKNLEDGQNRVFLTIYNETLDQAGYNQWTENEPNNWNDTEYCGSIFRNDGKLNDINCAHDYAFICEKEKHM